MNIHVHSGEKKKGVKLLTQSRAEKVKQYLIDKGISGERINAHGKGYSEPIWPDERVESIQLNERVMMKFYIVN